MAQAKRKTATKTAKKRPQAARQGSRQRSHAKQQKQGSNTFFLVSMSFLAATLLFANLLMFNLYFVIRLKFAPKMPITIGHFW